MLNSELPFSLICVLAMTIGGCGEATVANTSQGNNDTLNNSNMPLNDDVEPVTSQGGQPLLNLGPEGTSSVSIASDVYPLDAAIGDIWGIEGTHYHVDFTLTNGKFLIQAESVNGELQNMLVPSKASAVVYTELYSPGSSLAFDTYTFIPTEFVSGLAGNAYFANAYIGVDVNQSGSVDTNERFDIVDGLVTFTGVLPDIELRFSVTLENGQTATGHYTGLFDFADRR